MESKVIEADRQESALTVNQSTHYVLNTHFVKRLQNPLRPIPKEHLTDRLFHSL